MTHAPLTEHEIALAKAHFKRTASPELRAKMEAVDPVTGTRLGDDPEVIRAWLQRARGPEGLATVLYGTGAYNEKDEMLRARRLGDEAMRKSDQRHHPRPDADRIAAAFWPESRQ